MDLQVAKRSDSDMSGAYAVLTVLLPGDEGLAESACGTPEHNCSLRKQVSKSSYNEMQLPLPAGLDVYVSCSCYVRAVLGGRPSRPWFERDARPKRNQEQGKTRVRQATREVRGQKRQAGRTLLSILAGLSFTTAFYPQGAGYQLWTIRLSHLQNPEH